MAGGNSRRREMRHGPESAAWGPRVRVRPGLAGIFQEEEENADGTRHGQAARGRTRTEGTCGSGAAGGRSGESEGL